MAENLWKSLGTIGIAPKGTYNPDTTYYRGHLVSYEGSSYVALKNELTNVTPTDDDINWSLVMKGYNEKIIQATIPSNGWVGDTAPYTQTITVEGISEDDNPIVDIILSDDIETMQVQLEDYGKILKITTGDGNITVYSSDLTTTDLTILIQGISFSTEEYKETTANEVGIKDTYNIIGNGVGHKGILQTFLDNIANKMKNNIANITEISGRLDNIIAHNNDTEGNTELIDIRTDVNGITHDSAGAAVRSQINELKGGIDRVLNKHVIIPANSDDVIKFYIPKNTDFTFKTVDGNNFKITTTLRLLREDKSEIDYWSIFNTTNSRTVNSGGEDIYYIRVNPGLTIDQEINVSYKDEKTIESKVENLENKVENLENKIPSFYENYLDNRLLTIRENDLLIGNSGDSFIFITDLHNENNYYSPALADEICKKTSVKRIVYGGDYINEPSSKNDSINYLTTRRNKSLVSNDVVFLRGNHDTNPYGTGQLTISEFYSIFDKHIEKNINTNKKTYFYSDNVSQKIRYFYLDSGVNGTIESEQENWLKVKAKELDETWTIVVFVHHGIYTDVKDDRTNIKNYSSLTTIKESLSDTSAKVACVICGHTHIDMEDTSGNYPIVCTTCDAHGVQSSSASSDDRTVGTINEQAFDVFHIDTSNKKIYVTRIGGGKNNVRNGSDYTLNDREFSYI